MEHENRRDIVEDNRPLLRKENSFQETAPLSGSIKQGLHDEAEAQKVLQKIDGLPLDQSHKINFPEENLRSIDVRGYKKIAQETLEHIDFATLRNIFLEMRKKAGVISEDFFVDRDMIKVLLGKDGKGWGGSRREKIKLYAGFINPLDHPTPTLGELRNEVLSILIHEEMHTASNDALPKGFFRPFFEALKTLREGKTVRLTSGYYRRQISQGHYSRRFFSLNEGVTEKGTKKVYTEYLKRTGDRSYFSTGEEPQCAKTYHGGQALASAYIEVISEIAGIPREKVEEALLQGGLYSRI